MLPAAWQTRLAPDSGAKRETPIELRIRSALGICGLALLGTSSLASACPSSPFCPALDVFTSASGATSIAAIDVDQDGKQDIVLAGGAGNSIVVHRNLGSGVFASGQAWIVGDAPTEVVGRDLNGDGLVDLVVPCSDSLSILLGRGGGAFDPPLRREAGTRPRHIAVVDFNVDGIFDIVAMGALHTAIRSGGGVNGVWNGTFTPLSDVPISGATLRFVDIDHDGANDVIAPTGGESKIYIAFGRRPTGVPNGTFYVPQTLLSVGAPSDAIVRDFDGDGIDDIVASDAGSGSIGFHKGLGNRSFSSPVVRSVAHPISQLVLIDVTRDGVEDLVYATGAQIGHLPGGAGGTGPEGFFGAECLCDADGFSGAIVGAQLDEDSLSDLAMLSASRSQFFVLRGNAPEPPPTPTPSAELPTPLWPSGGVPVCAMNGAQTDPALLADGTGGLLVVWPDARASRAGPVYVQRLLRDGTIAPGWPESGRPLVTSSGAFYSHSIAPDGHGGIYGVVVDSRDGALRAYGHHILPDGSDDSRWASSGMPLFPAVQSALAIALRDGSGGLLVAYEDRRAGVSQSFRVQRFREDATVAPGWPASGAIVDGAQTSSSPPTLGLMQAEADGMGGAIVAWTNFQPACTGHGCFGPFRTGKIAGVRDGSVPWTASVGGGVNGPYSEIIITSDGLDGVLALVRFGFQSETLQRRLPSGVTPWGIDPAYAWGQLTSMVGDGVGGAILRGYGFQGDVHHIERINTAGGVSCCWPLPFGAAVPAASGPIIRDDSGGGYALWQAQGASTGSDIRGVHFTKDGSFSDDEMGDGGSVVVFPGNQSNPKATPDGEYGFFLAWVDDRNGDFDVYAQRFGFDTPVPVELTFVESVYEEGAVRLAWYATDAASAAFTLERRSASEDWRATDATLDVRGSLLQWRDTDIVAGQTYSYRLAWTDGGALRRSAPVVVTVPALAATELLGATKHPARASDRVRYRLASQAAGMIEIFDVRGRRIWREDLSQAAPGEHEFALGGAIGLRSGVHWVRLTHSGVSHTQKLVYLDR